MATSDRISEAGRQALHVYIDAASAWDWDDEINNDDLYVARANLALQRMNEVGAVKATLDDETDELDLDATDLLGSAVLAIHWLAGHLAVATNVDVENVYSDLRSFADRGSAEAGASD